MRGFVIILALMASTPSVRLLEVRPGTPPLEVRILPGPESENAENIPPDQASQPHRIGRVEIVHKGEPKPFQTIEVLGYGSSLHLTESRFLDVNFDGYTDLLLGHEGGAKWMGFQIHLYDPPSGTFVQTALSREMSENLTGADLNFRRKKKEILVEHLVYGCEDGLITSQTFAIQDDHLREIEEQQLLSTPEGCYELTSRARNGSMREVSRKRIGS